MKIIFITTNISNIPDPDDLGKWTPVQNAEDFLMQTLEDYHLFVHECLSDKASDKNNVMLKVEKKHAIVISWLKTILSFAEEQWGVVSKEDLYVILHDKDLLKHPYTNEGIYTEERIKKVGSGLENIIKDGHVYLFQHIPNQDMYQTLISNLMDPSIENIKQALEIINNCTDEA